MMTMHGATWLAGKTEGPVRPRRAAPPCRRHCGDRAVRCGGVWAAAIDGYVIGHFAGTDAPSNPLIKQVTRAAGGLLANYGAYPWMLAAPVVALGGGLARSGCCAARR